MTTWTIFPFSLALLLLPALAACSAGPDPSSSASSSEATAGASGQEGGAVAESDFPARYADIICGGEATCCSKGAHPFTNDAGCRSATTNQIKSLQNNAASHSWSYDQGAAGDCLALFQKALSACQTPFDQDIEDTCELVYHGTKTLGAPCDGNECGRNADGALLRCAHKSFTSQSSRSCQVVSALEAATGQRGKAGDVCRASCTLFDDHGISCEEVTNGDVPDQVTTCFTNDGLYCDGQHCVSQLAGGASCYGSDSCAAGLACHQFTTCNFPGPNCQPGVCEAPTAVGGSCKDGPSCGDEAYCDTPTKICVASKSLGQPCKEGEPDQCGKGRCEAGVCQDPRDLTSVGACDSGSSSN